jgi:NADH:ubiquinone oxidoreductase subunit K
MLLNQFLLLSAFLFCTGIYGVLTRKHTVLVLMSIELMLAAVNVNLVAFGAFHNSVIGQVFALFVLPQQSQCRPRRRRRAEGLTRCSSSTTRGSCH